MSERRSLSIRRVRLDEDRTEIMSFLKMHFPDWRDDSKFDWLYLANPAGRAQTWLLYDDDRIAGVSTAFPRKLGIGARVVQAWVLGDFCVAAYLRSLGPAVGLQRAVCEAVDKAEVDAFYDFPSQAMLAIYARLGVRPAGEMVRMVYPLRVDGIFETKIGVPVLSRPLGVVGNLCLRVRDALRRRDSAIEVCPFEREFPGGFEKEWVMAEAVVLQRSAEYLNWRFRQDPRRSISVLESGGGFLTFSRAQGQFSIEDVFGIKGEPFLRELVLEVVEIARAESASSVTVSISERHPWGVCFRKLGFQPRESVPFVLYTRPGILARDIPWFLTSGDRDS